MRWSYKCGKLLGIDLYVHVTFFLLLAYVLFEGLVDTYSLTLASFGVGLVIITFAIVVMHELGHSMAARHYGIPTHRIMLLPIGGVASLDRMPEEPKEELVVALAGPIVNLVLILVFGVIRYFCFGSFFMFGLGDFSMGQFHMFLHWMIILNYSLLLFNLIPAFPMDGGRVLRALLGYKFSYLRATEIAVNVGHLVAFGFVLYALFTSNFLLAVIALFVWRGGSTELNMLRQREIMRRIREDFGQGGQAFGQGFEMPNGDRVVLVPSSVGWRFVRMVTDNMNRPRGVNVDLETIYRNMAHAGCREEGEDDEPRAKIIDVK